MNHLMMARGRTDHDAKTNMRFFKPILLSLIFIVFGGVSSFAQDRSGKTVGCPAACPGTCWYVIDLIKDPPDTNGCFNAHLNMFYGSTGAPRCLADIDRSLGGGTVKYTLCNGTKENCNLSDKNFPDGSAIPYAPGDTPGDSTKVVLSPGCHGAITITPGGGGASGGTYNFNNISSITADFNMRLYCYCAGVGGDTIVDSLKYQYGIVHDADVEEVHDEVPIEDDEEGGRIYTDSNEESQGNKLKIDRAETIQNEIGYKIESIYPNPVVDVLNIRLTLDQPEEMQFTIVDDHGNWMQNDIMNLPAGKNDIPINLQQNLQSGHFYYFLIHRESGKFSTTKIYMK